MNVLNYERDSIAVHNGELTYTEITTNSLRHIEEKSSLNAFLHLHDGALNRAKVADERANNAPLLNGMTIALKDNTNQLLQWMEMARTP